MKIDPLWFWYLLLMIWIGIIALVLMLPIGHAATLELIKNATGLDNQTSEVLPDIRNRSIEEALCLLGPAYNFNISRDGLVTFENGSAWQIVQCPNTHMWEERRA